MRRGMKARFLLLTLLAFGTLARASALPATADTASADVLKAEGLWNAGKYLQAVDILNRYLATHPQDARALVDRGDDYDSLGRYPEAITDYSAALAINPQYAYAYASRADSHYSQHEYTLALVDADKALELRPKFGYGFRVRTLVRLETGDISGAQSDGHEAIAIDPGNAYSYAYACRADRVAEALDVARKECAKALQLDPSNYSALFQSGRLQLEASDWSGAESTYSALLKMEDNDDASASYWRASARYQLRHADDALSDVNVYVKRYPDDGDGLYLRAEIEQLRGDLSAAKSDASSALAHYGIDNDTDGMAQAKALLAQLEAAHP
jgi:tetratricopeptide (TPR) repeat protein